MNKREAERQIMQVDILCRLGFTKEQAESLRHISMTLRRWYEKECGIDGGYIERDEVTGKPYWHNSYTGRRYPVRDAEKGAIRRLDAIITDRNSKGRETDSHTITKYAPLSYYLQTDPRGAALYILRPGDVPSGEYASAYYPRGICVY